jgi:uncharacterized protein (TIGR02996 family)
MPSTADNPFLKAVVANPDDDLTRLVYADWLEENDQPERAEFVRVQVALAAGVTDLAQRLQLEDRQRELLVAHDTEWVRELAEVLDMAPGRWGGWVFRRGFVEYFHLPAYTLVAEGALLAELTPVRELYLNPTVTRDVVMLCRCPWLTRVRDLYFITGSVGIRPAGVRALIRSPYTDRLKKVVIEFSESATGDATLMGQYTRWYQQVQARH